MNVVIPIVVPFHPRIHRLVSVKHNGHPPAYKVPIKMADLVRVENNTIAIPKAYHQARFYQAQFSPNAV